MGKLREVNGSAQSFLLPEHLIGRGLQCSLRLEQPYVSTQHAIVRWNSGSWELVDRGSRNGTYLDGLLVELRKPYPLRLGCQLAFGHTAESWQLVDATGPEVCVLCVAANLQLLGTDGVIGVPSAQDPECTVYRDVDGLWKLELQDNPALEIDDGYSWEAAGRLWQFSCPRLIGATVTAEQTLSWRELVLSFRVSRDEEFVELIVERSREHISLGCRAHNYLLLLLARARCEDRAAQQPDSTCGWIYKDQLADSLRMTPQQIDGEVFRIRKHFAEHGLEEAATVIERRPRTKQLRLGAAKIRITQV